MAKSVKKLADYVMASLCRRPKILRMNTRTVLAETAAVLNFLAVQEGPHLADLPAPVMREVYGQLGKAFDSPLDPSIRCVDFQGAKCRLRGYIPGKPEAGPIIIYLHGGGWVIGDLNTHDALCGHIAGISGLRVVSVDYRLAPEHRFPRAHEDCLAETAFLAGSPAELEAPVTGLAVAGDSAGGNLAFSIAAGSFPQLLGQLLMYPLVDCTTSTGGSYEEFAEGYVLDRRLVNRFVSDYLPDERDRKRAEVSPLLHPIPPGIPKTVVLTAGLDPLRDQGRDLAQRLIAGGVETHYMEAEGLIHGMATMRGALPTADRIVTRAIMVFADIIKTAQVIQEGSDP